MQIIFILIFILVLVAAFSLLRFLLPFIVVFGIFMLLRSFITGGGFKQNTFTKDDYSDDKDPFNGRSQNYSNSYKNNEKNNSLEEQPLSVKDAEFFNRKQEVIDVPYKREDS